MLVDELRAIGLADAALDDNGYVFATLPATNGAAARRRADRPRRRLPGRAGRGRGADRAPRLRRRPRGAAARRHACSIPPDMPVLAGKAGHDVVTSSGDTLLGADDKAGVAEIMAAVAHLAAHPELPRPTLKVGFTPDEEIGEGATLFDVERFGAACAYTLDGSQPGRDPGRDVLGHRGDRRLRGRRHPPRLGDGQARQRRAAGGAAARRAPRRLADARDDGGPRGLRPPLRALGRRRPRGGALHRARLRRRRCSPSTSR